MQADLMQACRQISVSYTHLDVYKRQPEALMHYMDNQSRSVLIGERIFNETELACRLEVELEKYTMKAGQCPVAHRTVRCTMRQQPSPTAILVVGVINTPNHPPFIVSKFSNFLHLTRAITFNTRHTKEIKSSPKSIVEFQSNSG